MNCPYCNTELSENEAICPICGAAVESKTEEIADAEPQKDKGKIFGIISLALGGSSLAVAIFGCCCCTYLTILLAPLLAIAGLAMGIVAVIMSKKSGHKNTMGIIGAILSAAALALVLLFIIFYIIILVFYLIVYAGSIFGSAMYY